MSHQRPLVLLQPAPQRTSRIFSPAALAALDDSFEVIDLDDLDDPAAFDAALPDAFAIIVVPVSVCGSVFSQAYLRQASLP